MVEPTPAQALAEAVGAEMYRRDPLSAFLGITLEEIRPGYARLKMVVRREMLNAHGICHGGMLFSLADTAFAYSCNSHNLNTVAAGCGIDYIAPAREGDELTAVAEERALSGRTGVYDVTVYGPTGAPVALMRGKSFRIKGEVLGGQEDV